MRINFKDPATSVMEGIIDFHQDIQVYLLIIVTFVTWMLFSIVYKFGILLYIRKNINTEQREFIEKFVNFLNPKPAEEKVHDDRMVLLRSRTHSLITKTKTHGVVLEIVWTILPVFVLIAIAVPSFALLYSIDEIVEPVVTLKVIGNQWYWSYEYSNYLNDKILFDSYMIAENDLQVGDLRLLEVDRKIWLPINTPIRILITGRDVLHSWAVPSLGVKMDAVPGRLNQVGITINRMGIFYGQCSELCGVNHGFMPIVVKAVPVTLFVTWVNFLFNKDNS